MELSGIRDRLERVRLRVQAACERSGREPDRVTVIGVTKGAPAAAVREAAAVGMRDFGENRVQEAAGKRPQLAGLPGDVRWHMIGSLQRNKVREALKLFDIIHSVDSTPLAEEISRRAPDMVPVFLQVNAAGETQKHGFSLEELPSAFETISRLSNVRIVGLMTIAPLADDAEASRPVFRRLKAEADALGLGRLSMGMTNDFETAIEEGATEVRIGRAIFGERAG
jgi:PLP dependent protein